MISYNNSAPTAVNNVGQFGATEGSIGAYKSAAEYAADSKYWALLSQKGYGSMDEVLKEVERLFTEGALLKEDIEALKLDFENQNQILMGLIQQTGEAIDNTNTATNNANAATDSANQAVQDVLAQLDKISNMSVVASTLPPGTPATGSFDSATGVFSFGIPEGLPGRDGTDGTISDIGDVAIGTPVSDDYGFFVDKDDGGLYRTPMSEIAKLVPAVASFNGRVGQVVPADGDYTVAQVTGAAASGVNDDINQIRGLTTALSVSQGGTAAKNADDARTNLSAMLESKTGLDGTTNLNDLDGLKAGFYYQPVSANAKPELNYPVQLAGSLVVVKTGAGTDSSCKQVYSLYNNPNVTYSRVLDASAGPTSPWSEWRRHTAIDRVKEGTTTTDLYSPGDAKLQVGTSGLWGCTDGTEWVALGLAQGGTGATTAAGAKANLNLDRFGAIGSETQMFSPSGSKKIIISNDKWGAYDTTAAKYLPLGVEQGGTGGGTADAARMSLVAAKSGDNSDITSMTNKVTFTQSPVVPDAVDDNDAVTLRQLRNSVVIAQTIADLRNIEPTPDGQTVILKEHTAGTGYGGGRFRSVVAGSSFSDNNGTVIKTPLGAAWLRVNADVINPLMFGAIPDGATDCSQSFTNALSAGSIFVPEGSYLIKNVQVPNNTSIRGLGYNSKIIVEPGTTALKLGNASASTTVAYFDGCHVDNLHFVSSTNTVANTIAIETNGLSSSVISNIYYTKCQKVINQIHAEGVTFSNISNSDLEDGSTDCAFIIYSVVSKRSNDNIYQNFIARATNTGIYLGKAAGTDTTAQHDGITIKDCILFPTVSADSIYIANCIHSAVLNNKLFVPARNGIRIESACINTTIMGNEVTWPGRLTSGGADGILIQTTAGSSATAYGQCVISNNTISMPSGCGFRISGLGQFNLTDNIIVSPNNIATTQTGTFTPKNYDAIRINSGCGYFKVSDNLVTTGRHGQGTDNFSTNWRYDVYIEANAVNGIVNHDTINVHNLSPYVAVNFPVIKYTQGRHLIANKEINSPYADTGWTTVSGTGTVSVASATNPYTSELTNLVLQFNNTEGTSVFSQGQGVTAVGDAIGAVFKVRCTSPTSAYVTFTINVAGNVFVQRNTMVGTSWAEFDLRRIGAGAGAVTFQVSTPGVCTIQIAELRVTKTAEATQASGIYYGTSAPVSGYFKLGDEVKNSGPSVGTSKGWVCTASGIPGTWASLGSL